MPRGKVGGIALVELLRLIKFRMALRGGVCAQPADPLEHGSPPAIASSKWVGWAQLTGSLTAAAARVTPVASSA